MNPYFSLSVEHERIGTRVPFNLLNTTNTNEHEQIRTLVYFHPWSKFKFAKKTNVIKKCIFGFELIFKSLKGYTWMNLNFSLTFLTIPLTG